MNHNKDKNEKPVDTNENQPGIGYVVPFFLVLAVLTVVSFIIPLRPTVSYIEKRSLAEFPEFSVEALISGSYFDDITTWYSDTFPGREEWLTLAAYTSSCHGHSDIMIQGEIGQSSDAVSEIPEATGPVTIPPTEETEPPSTENIVLTEEEAPTDPVEEWGGVNVEDYEVLTAGTTIIQIGDALFSPQGFSQYQSERFAATVNTAAALVAEDGVRVVSAPPPTAIGVMIAPEHLPTFNSANQSEMLDYLNGCLSDSVIGINTVETLLDHNDEYIFFRTDHHWTALAAYYVYVDICEALGMEPSELSDYELWDQGEFQGSLYWRAPQPGALTLDHVYAYNPVGDITTHIYEQDGSGFEWTVLTDMSEGNIGSKYLTFLAGDHPLMVITNNSIPDAPNCVIIKDSYGNCLAPFFVHNYHNVYIIDYRSYYTTTSHFVDTFDIDVVIFAPNLCFIQSDSMNDKLISFRY